jgi:Peptidase family M48
MKTSGRALGRLPSRWSLLPTLPAWGPRFDCKVMAAVAAVTALAALLPARLSAAEASAPSAGSAPSYVPGAVVRFGYGAMFRRIVPSPVLEAQSAVEYTALVERARENGGLLPATHARVERVRAIVMRIAPFADKWSDRVKDWRWEVNVVRSPRIGMYCLPGGKILIYTGLIDRIRPRDDELGVLFGHEIAHALREQVREKLNAQQATPLGASPMPRLYGVAEFDGTAPLTPPTIGSPVASIQYDATDETEADVIGDDIAARAGFDPRAAVPLWDKLAEATRRDSNGFIRIHPYSDARRSDIIKRMPDMLALYAKAQGVTVEQLPRYGGTTAKPVAGNAARHR